MNREERELSSESVARLHPSWRMHVRGGASSTPIIFDHTAYFGAWDGRLYAVDAQTGEIRWQRTLTSTLIRSTPLVTDDRVYVASVDHFFALARSDGQTLYSVTLDTHPQTLIDASPKLIDGMIVLGVSAYENSLDKSDYTFVGSLVALDAASGGELWRVRMTDDAAGRCRGGAGVSVWSSAAIDPELGLLYIGTGQTFEEPSSTCADSLVAIHYAREYVGERIAWVAQYTKEDVYAQGTGMIGPDADIGASPNLFEAAGRKLVGAGDKGGSYRAFDRRTGEPAWRVDLELGTYTQVGGVMATAAVADGTVFVVGNRWLLGGWVLTGTHNPSDTAVLYALDAANGGIRWRVELPAPVIGSLAVAGGMLFHPTITGTVYARDLATGRALWSAQAGQAMGSGISVADGRVYLSDGIVMSGGNTDAGGTITSFSLDAAATIEIDARAADAPQILNEQECQTELAHRTQAQCSTCLCACDATAWGHCGPCVDLAPCMVQFCSLAAPGPDMRACLELFCAAKTLPPGTVDSTANAASCAIRCAEPCQFSGM